MGMTLRAGSRDYYYAQLDRLFPGLKERYIQCYGTQYELVSPNQEALMRQFRQTCDAHGIVRDNRRIFAYLHTFEEKEEQLSLF